VARPRGTGKGMAAAEAVSRKIKAFMAANNITKQRVMAAKVILDDGSSLSPKRLSELIRRDIKEVEGAVYIRPLAQAMGCSYEFLVDPDTDWPPPDQVKIGEVVTSRSMARLIDFILTLDPNPEKAIRIALGRIMGVDRPVMRPEFGTRLPTPPNRGSREESG
jgi:hypothetical protein